MGSGVLSVFIFLVCNTASTVDSGLTMYVRKVHGVLFFVFVLLFFSEMMGDGFLP